MQPLALGLLAAWCCVDEPAGPRGATDPPADEPPARFEPSGPDDGAPPAPVGEPSWDWTPGEYVRHSAPGAPGPAAAEPPPPAPAFGGAPPARAGSGRAAARRRGSTEGSLELGLGLASLGVAAALLGHGAYQTEIARRKRIVCAPGDAPVECEFDGPNLRAAAAGLSFAFAVPIAVGGALWVRAGVQARRAARRPSLEVAPAPGAVTLLVRGRF